MSTATADIHAHDLPADTRTNYLNVDHSVKSWLLTKDHKRIALLYLISITLMFFAWFPRFRQRLAISLCR
jgi:cytochrome c oxidase subunit 1